MSYALVYTMDGNEFWETPLTSLDAVNAEIRKLYDEHGSVTILRIEEDHDGPRTWAIEYPSAPPAGTRFTNRSGERSLEISEDGRVMIGMTSYSWKGVLEDFGPLTEVVETEVEAAARRLRERGWWKSQAWEVPSDLHKDIRTVLAHVLNGGQL